MKSKFLTFILLTLLAIAPNAYSQNIGAIKGKIIDMKEGYSLAGATVRLGTTGMGAYTNKNGEFTIVKAPIGTHKLIVSYIGYKPYSQEIQVNSEKTLSLRIELEAVAIVKGDVLIIGEQLKGQAKALNQQRTNTNITNVVSSDQVGKFPDANIGDAMKRISGITMQYDQGEARFGLIRGTAAYLSSITLNGDRIPSAEGSTRTVQLDLVPADMVSIIEVNKAVTPEMDADAIGGSINLITKTTPNKSRVSATFGSGLNFLSEKPIWNGSLTAGTRFLDDKIGVVVRGSLNDHFLGSDNIEALWNEGPNGAAYLSDFQVRTYQIRRVRQSVSAGLDYKISPNHTIFFNTIYNHRNDWENRYRLRLRYDKGDKLNIDGTNYAGLPNSDGVVKNVSVYRQTKGGLNDNSNDNARLEDQRTFDFSLSGEHLFANILKMNWQGNWAKASEERPHERYIAYKNKKVSISPNISDENEPQYSFLDGTDLSKYSLDELTEQYQYTDDIDLNAKLDFELPLMAGNYKNKVKFGARIRNKDKKRSNNFYSYTPTDAALEVMTSASLSNKSDDNFLAGNYMSGDFVSNSYLGDLDFNNSSLFEKTDLKEEYAGANYSATEKITAGYLQLEQNIGSKFLVLAGLRIENTNVDYKANQFTFDEDNEDNPYIITPTEGNQNYTDILPAVHLKFSFSDDLIVRAAWTNTLARPNYYDLAPYREEKIADNELEEGNVKLKPTKSMNLDLMADYYLESIGIISGGVFYKKIDDYFYTNVTKNYLDPTTQKTFDTYYHPENGAKATLFGFEAAFQRQLDFLPGFLKGFGIYANYTFTNSNAEGLKIEGREQEDVALPGTANHMINASLSYEMYGVSARMSLNYTSDYVDEFYQSEFYDRYYDSQLFLDFNASYAVTDQFRVFMEVNNITNQPLRYYQGKNQNDRVMQAEFYNRRITAGIKFDL